MRKITLFFAFLAIFIVMANCKLFADTDVLGLRCRGTTEYGDFFFKFYSKDSSNRITNFYVLAGRSSGDNLVQTEVNDQRKSVEIKVEVKNHPEVSDRTLLRDDLFLNKVTLPPRV